MIKIGKNGMTPQLFRIILVVVLALTLVAGSAGFVYVEKILRNYAQDTRALNSQAAASDQNITILKQLKDYLATHKDDEARANQVVAESKQYKYQNEIVNDLTAYAASSGVTISDFNFTSAQSSTTTGASESGSTPSAVPTGVAPSSMTFTVQSPVDYNHLLNFIRRIEQNITKMQIANVSIKRSIQNGTVVLSADAFTIEVYLRK